MSDQENAAEVIDVPRPLPGELMRQAREKQGLTLAEVAGALKFSTRQIDALENNDFQQLQGKAFLRGFVRAYARLLKLPPDPLLDMLSDESAPVPDLIVVPANMGETNPLPFYRRHGKKLGFIALLLLLSGGMVWFSGVEPSAEPQAQPVGLALPVEKLENIQQQPMQEASPVSALPLSGTVAQPLDLPTPLVFEFSDRSWLEVRNASGKVLLTGEFPAGQTQTITDKPPYQIWIGKASAVKLSYGGRVVELQPYTREEVARFTLE